MFLSLIIRPEFRLHAPPHTHTHKHTLTPGDIFQNQILSSVCHKEAKNEVDRFNIFWDILQRDTHTNVKVRNPSMQSMGLCGSIHSIETVSSIRRKNRVHGRKGTADSVPLLLSWIPWDLAKSKWHSHNQHKNKCRTGPSKTGPKVCREKAPWANPRPASQKSGATMTFPPPRPSRNCLPHGQYLEGGTYQRGKHGADAVQHCFCPGHPCRNQSKNVRPKRLLGKVQTIILDKGTWGRPGSHTTDFWSWHFGTFGPGSCHTPNGMRFGTNDVVWLTRTGIGVTDHLTQCSRNPPLRNGVVCFNLAPSQWTNRALFTP